MAGVVASYEELLEEVHRDSVSVPQNCALQLLFNLRFLGNILAVPKESEVRFFPPSPFSWKGCLLRGGVIIHTPAQLYTCRVGCLGLWLGGNYQQFAHCPFSQFNTKSLHWSILLIPALYKQPPAQYTLVLSSHNGVNLWGQSRLKDCIMCPFTRK